MRLARAACLAVVMMFSSPIAAFDVAADGMMYTFDPYFDEWGMSAEDSQFCLILHQDGIEMMALSIKVHANALEDATRACWVFQVPSAPENVDIDIVQQVPHLQGEKMSKLADDELSSDFMLMSCTQIYPALMIAPALLLTSDGYGFVSRAGESYNDSGFTVFESISQYGVTSELVSSESGVEVAEYLSEKNLSLPSATQELLDEYVGGDYSFVISWISDVQAFRTHASSSGSYYSIGTFVRFPTERVFYPMRLTSVYGQTKVPVVVQVLGFVSPDPSSHDGYGVKKECLLAPYHATSSVIGLFDQTPETRVNDRLVFTEIAVDAPSSAFAEDLWFDSGAPSGEMAKLVIEHAWVVTVVIFVAASMISGAASGLAVFWGYGPSLLKFGALGLFNLLTVLALAIATSKLEVHRNFTRPKNGIYPNRRTLDFVFLYSVSFLATILLMYLGVSVALL